MTPTKRGRRRPQGLSLSCAERDCRLGCDEFIRSQGADGPAAFKAVIERSGNDIDYRLQKLRAEYNTETSDGKVAYLEAASKIIASLSSPIEQDVYASKLCKEFGVDKNAFKTQLEQLSRRSRREGDRKLQQKIRAELSGRGDLIDTDKAKAPRSSSAEEALVVYLIRNPDAAERIAEKLSPDQFQNALMRRYYTYFSERIRDGRDAMMNITADFTAEEANKIYQMLSKHASVAQTGQSLEEYIKVIREESMKHSRGDVSAMSPEDLNKLLLDKRRESKK